MIDANEPPQIDAPFEPPRESRPSLRPLSVPTVDDGRAPAFRELYDGHVAFVWRNLRRLGVPECETDDRTQEVFVVAHRRFQEFEERGHGPRAWLFQIVLRVASGARRHRRRHPEIPDGGLVAAQGVIPPPQAEAIERKQRLAQLDAALGSLDHDRITRPCYCNNWAYSSPPTLTFKMRFSFNCIDRNLTVNRFY